MTLPNDGSQEDEIGMEIAGGEPSRGWIKWGIVFLLAILLVGGLLVLVFYQFVASWWVAVLVVGLMLLYMMILARTAQGSTDRRDW